MKTLLRLLVACFFLTPLYAIQFSPDADHHITYQVSLTKVRFDYATMRNLWRVNGSGSVVASGPPSSTSALNVRAHVEYAGGSTIDTTRGNTFWLPISVTEFTWRPEVNYVSWRSDGAAAAGYPKTVANGVSRSGTISMPAKSVDMTYKFYDAAGNLVSTFRIPAGEAKTLMIQSPDGTDLTYDGLNDAGVEIEGGIIPVTDLWGGGEGTIPGVNQANSGVISRTEPIAIDTSLIDPKPEIREIPGDFFVDPSSITNSSSAADNATIIKGSNVIVNAIAQTGGTIGAKIDAVTAAVKAIPGTGGGGEGGSGGTVDLAPVTAAIGTTNTKLTAIDGLITTGNGKLDSIYNRIGVTNTKIDEVKEAVTGARAEDETRRAETQAAVATAVSSSAAGASSLGSSLSAGITSLAASAPTAAGSAGDYASRMTITLPVAFGGNTIDLNPLSRPGLAAVASAFRAALAALALVMLYIYISERVSALAVGAAASQQTVGNTVAGSGAQITALVNASVVAAALVTFVTGLASWSFGALDFAVVKAAASAVDPVSTFPADAYAFLREFFPVTTIWLCLLARGAFNFYSSALFAVATSIVRFAIA